MICLTCGLAYLKIGASTNTLIVLLACAFTKLQLPKKLDTLVLISTTDMIITLDPVINDFQVQTDRHVTTRVGAGDDDVDVEVDLPFVVADPSDLPAFVPSLPLPPHTQLHLPPTTTLLRKWSGNYQQLSFTNWAKIN